MTDHTTARPILTIPAAIARAADIVAARTPQPVEAAPEAVAMALVIMARKHGLSPAPAYLPAITDYLSGYGVMLHGNTGVGKTFLMRALGAKIWPVSDIVDCGLDGLKYWYQRTDGADICIDDIGTEPVRVEYGARDDMMRAVIAHRADRQSGRTSVTTNLTAEKIAARYGDRTLSRLIGMCRVHEIAGPNRRSPRQHGAGSVGVSGAAVTAFPVAGRVFENAESEAS